MALPQLHCACAMVRRASRAVTQRYGEALRGTGLEITQFALLQALSRMGEVTQGRLAEVLVIDSTTLSRSLAPMERQGWIASRKGTDRRQRYLRTTKAGEVAMAPAVVSWERAQARLQKQLGTEGWNAMMRAMEEVTLAAL